MEPSPAPLPRWYWIVAGLGLAWMLVGVAAFVMDVTLGPAGLAEMSEGQRHLYEARPGWILAAYALAVVSGVVGAAGLLLRRRWTVPVLATSLAAAVVQFGYVFLVMGAIGRIGAAAAVPLPAAVLLIGAGLLRLAVVAAQRGWLPDRLAPVAARSAPAR
jgi:hypothetical protein